MKPNPKPGMKRSRTSWSTKLRPEMTPAVATDPKGRGKMLLPTPMLVAEEISAIPHGQLLTVPELRLRLTRRFDADFTCPLMTGIFFNIIAGAAEEQLAADERPLAPYWRVVLVDGTLSHKTPTGQEKQAEHLRQEGHSVGLRGTKLQVSGFVRRTAI